MIKSKVDPQQKLFVIPDDNRSVCKHGRLFYVHTKMASIVNEIIKAWASWAYVKRRIFGQNVFFFTLKRSLFSSYKGPNNDETFSTQ